MKRHLNPKFKAILYGVFIIGLFVGNFVFADNSTQLNYDSTYTVTVHSGDTMYDIIKREYGESYNYDQVNYEVKQLNKGKDMGAIYPGEEFEFPKLEKKR